MRGWTGTVGRGLRPVQRRFIQIGVDLDEQVAFFDPVALFDGQGEDLTAHPAVMFTSVSG